MYILCKWHSYFMFYVVKLDEFSLSILRPHMNEFVLIFVSTYTLIHTIYYTLKNTKVQ